MRQVQEYGLKTGFDGAPWEVIAFSPGVGEKPPPVRVQPDSRGCRGTQGPVVGRGLVVGGPKRTLDEARARATPHRRVRSKTRGAARIS